LINKPNEKKKLSTVYILVFFVMCAKHVGSLSITLAYYSGVSSTKIVSRSQSFQHTRTKHYE